MPFVAPWINPPDYLAAMRSGAGIGLNLRQQDIAEEEAAARLQESYAHLESEQQLERQRMSIAQANQQAAMALRAQQADSLNKFRQSEIENQQARMNTISPYESASLDLRQKELDSKTKADFKDFHNGDGTVTRVHADGTTETLGTPKQTPLRHGSLRLDNAGNVLGATGPENSPEVKQLLDQKAKADAEAAAAALRPSWISRLFGAKDPTATTNATPFKIISIRKRDEQPDTSLTDDSTE